MQDYPESTTEDEAGFQPQQETGEVKDTLRACGEKIREAVEYRARDLGESTLHSLSESIGAYGTAFQSASESLEQQEERRAADFVRQVSESLRSTADTINSATTDEALEYASNQIKFRPALALGCAFACGLAISRLLAVEQSRHSESETTPSSPNL